MEVYEWRMGLLKRKPYRRESLCRFVVICFHLQTGSVVNVSLGPVIRRGYLGVDAFFVLSGFVLSMVYVPKIDRFSIKAYGSFLARRVVKIYSLHLITFLLAVVLVLAAQHTQYSFRTEFENIWWSALCNVFLLHAWGLTHQLSWNLVSWSVSAEWFAYTLLFFPMILVLRRWSREQVAGLAGAAWLAFLFICQFVFRLEPKLTYLGIFRIMPEFLCGYALYRSIGRIAGRGAVLVAAGAGIVVADASTCLHFSSFLCPECSWCSQVAARVTPSSIGCSETGLPLR
jgi:peptidoglycan/LPS O-acetylase OafA/YrhL